MSSDVPESERPWRLYVAIGLVVVLVGAGLFFAGGQPQVVEDRRPQGQDSEGQRQRDCEEQLAGIMAAIDPQQLGLSSRQSDRAFDLNLWRDDCGQLLVAEQIAQDETLVRQMLASEVADRVLTPKYGVRDVSHLRTMLLLRQAAEHITAGVQNPLEQAVRIFDFVQRNILEGGPDAPTMTPYEILLIGRGNAQQRAWVLAELLRQVELDAVIVRPLAAGAAESDRWLIGVPIAGESGPQVYLFDAVIGLPVPASEEKSARTPFVAKPATLTQVRADDSLLRELDLPDSPYRFKADDFELVQIGLIGDSSVWSNRMAAIDYAIELRGATFYDGLGPNRLKPESLQARIATAGQSNGWDADDLFIWEYPEEQLAAFGTSTAVGAELLAGYQAVLSGPVIEDIPDVQSGEKLKWDHPLIDGRHSQIAGAYRQAIQAFNPIRRGVGVFTIDAVNDRVHESAVYWTTGCQYELGEFESVVNMGMGGQYPPAFRTAAQPIWADGMGRLVAFGLAQVGAYPQAAQLLSQFPPPQPHGMAYMNRRWVRLAQPASNADSPIAPAVAPEDQPTKPTEAASPGDPAKPLTDPPPTDPPTVTPPMERPAAPAGTEPQ